MGRNRDGWVARCALLLFAFVAFSSLASGDTCDRMQVNFKAGQLSIQSGGCSLQQVLEAVREKTGIQLEMPPLVATVPITVTIEAGEPTAVLTTLLAGTNFNYIIVAGAGNLPAQVILTDVPAAAATTAPAISTPTADATAPVPASVVTAKKSVKPKKEKNKEDEAKNAEPQVASGGDDGGQPKPEIDDATLKKLPQLPPGLPAAMWRMYPDLVQSILQNGGSLPLGAPTSPNGSALGQPVAAQANPVGPDGVLISNYIDPPPPPKGVIGLPTLPPGIDPNIGKLYPWNLMQLIHGPMIYPDIKLPPMAQPIRAH